MTCKSWMTRMAHESVMTSLGARMTAKATVCTTAMPASSREGIQMRSNRNAQGCHGQYYRGQSP